MTTLPAWVVLIVRLPPHPSSLRVKAWGRLRAVGAVALKNSVYLLPATAENQEHLQWLAQEVQKDGGDATLLRVAEIENVKPADLVRLFQEARDDDYRHLAERYRAILQSLGPNPTSTVLEAEVRDLEGLRARCVTIRSGRSRSAAAS